MPLKEPFKTSPHCLGARILHRAQFQNITAKLIPHGQGFTPLAPASPPAFEVNRPYLIDRLGASPIAQPPPSLERRRARFCVRPARSNTRLKVLSLAASLCWRKYSSRILRGPQDMCASFKRIILHTSSSASCLA